MSLIQVEYNGNFQLKEITDDNNITWLLEGECSKCGKCCKTCDKLKYETLDGKPQYVCSIYTMRPVGCMVWPTLPEEISNIPECTLRIIKKEI